MGEPHGSRWWSGTSPCVRAETPRTVGASRGRPIHGSRSPRTASCSSRTWRSTSATCRVCSSPPRSDGGLTWARTTRLTNDGYFNDKDSVTADPLNANRAYVVWDRTANHRVPVWFSRTLDGGRTWAPARQIFDQGDGRAEIGSIIVPLVNGQLLDVFTLIYNYDSHPTYDVAASR